MRGRKAKPTNLKRLEGNPGKRNLSVLEPIPPPEIPEPPRHLNAYAMEEWARISEQLGRMGLLTMVDQGTLGAYCSAYATWRQAEEELEASMTAQQNPMALFSIQLPRSLLVSTSNGTLIPNPLIGIRNKAAADMARYAEQFGFTPSSRARLGIDIHRLQKSKFDGLVGGRRAAR